MGAWTLTYEQQPKSFNNPGYGARQISQLKTNVRERGEIGHIWGANEATLNMVGGLHKEGSARAYVLDNETTNRPPESQIVDSEVGRIRVDFQELVDPRERDGETDNFGRRDWLSGCACADSLYEDHAERNS